MEKRVKTGFRYSLAVVLTLAASTALAQDRLGALLDAGGKRVEQDLAQAVAGTKLNGPSPSAQADMVAVELREGGTATGQFFNKQYGQTGSAYGKWNVERGKLCFLIRGRLLTEDGCFNIYRLGDKLYRPVVDSEDPATPVVEMPR
jgi:hypothetical protein